MASARDHDAAPEQATAPGPRSGGPVSPPQLLNLQRAAGNAAVAHHVQRYAVGVPATASYSTLMAWMASSNPYQPDAAAKTKAKFSYNVVWEATGEAGAWVMTPSSASTVTLTKSVDMPTWTATDAKLQSAWAAGVSALRTHESTHEALADTWRTTLEGRVNSFSMTSSAANEAAARVEANAGLGAQWQTWIDDHQTAQNGLDPYLVDVKDPHAAPAPPPTPAPGTESEAGSEAGSE